MAPARPSRFSTIACSQLGQMPMPLAPIGPGGVRDEFVLLHQCKGSSRRGLVNTNELADFCRLQARCFFEHLENGELCGADSAVPKSLLVHGGRGPRGLTQRGAITGQGLKLHIRHNTCIYIALSSDLPDRYMHMH